MEFKYTDPSFRIFLQDKKREMLEKEIESATLDLVGPDRWYEGSIYTAIIDKKYELITVNDEPETIEIIVQFDNGKSFLEVWLDTWRIVR